MRVRRGFACGALLVALGACSAGSSAPEVVESPAAPAASKPIAVVSAAADAPAPPTAVDAATTEPEVKSFTVMSYNIYVANPQISEVVRLVHEADPVVVCLQETIPASQAALRRDLHNTYPHMEFHVGQLGNGPGVLSKVPFRNGRYVPSAHGYNGFWIGDFTIMGREVQIANVHLHPTAVGGGIRGLIGGWRASETIRMHEVHQLVALLDPEVPAVLLGDFNSPSSGSTYERTVAFGFADAFREGAAPPSGTPTFHGKLRGFPLPVRIDYVFYRGELSAPRSGVLKEGTSDHFPVVVTLAWRP